jgi:hypothetical protein
MNNICGINRITPRWGFRLTDDSFRRATPYAIDLWAFSPMSNKKMSLTDLNDAHTIIYGNQQSETNTDYLPLKFGIATDGIFISETDKNHIQYRGAFVESINDIPIDSLLKKVRKIRSTENKYGEYWKLCNLSFLS